MFLKSHFDTVEKQLLCMSEVARSAGHNIHIGGARESFVRQFLRDHIGDAVGIGTGEVFDVSRRIGDTANQVDVLLYDQKYPRVHFGDANAAGYMMESIYAGIEVKSRLTQEHLEKTLRCASNLKSLKIPRFDGKLGAPQGIPYYLVDYGGPTIETVRAWLIRIEKEQKKLEKPELYPRFLEGIFLLGRGFILDCSVAHFPLRSSALNVDKPYRWLVSNSPTGNLYCLFFLLNLHIQFNELEHYFASVIGEYDLVPWSDEDIQE
jgi:hypothetical protein